MVTEARQGMEFGAGHMGELAVRHTRLGSDYVRQRTIPILADQLIAGKLTLASLMTLHRDYFRNPDAGPPLAYYIAAPKRDHIVDPHEKTSYVAPNVNNGVRVSEVESKSLFIHPRADRLREFGEELVDGMGRLMQYSGEMGDRHIREILYRFHMLFSLLHLPTDGSGRFIGDVDTLLQVSLQKHLGRKRNFKPNLISINGFRSGGDERWSIDEETRFRACLLKSNEEPPARSKKNKSWDLSLGDLVPFPDATNEAKYLQSKYKELYEADEEQQSAYYDALDGKIKHFIDFIFDENQLPEWFTLLGAVAVGRRGRFDKRQYHFSEKYEPYTNLIDTLIAHWHYRNYHDLARLLEEPDLVTSKVLALPGVDRVIDRMIADLGRVSKLSLAHIYLSNSCLAQKYR